jgi:CRP/FNR family cyclic AMP-dependent transcriptional regulator
MIVVIDETLAGLKLVPYFAEVPDEALAELAAAGVIRNYPRNAIIITEGDEPGPLFIILSGKVQVYLSNPRGRTVTLSTQESGSFFGELSLLDEAPRSASVSTMEPTVCCMIPRNAFHVWLQHHPNASIYIIRSLTQRVRTLTENVRALALLDVYGRLIKTLQNLAVEDGEEWIIKGKFSHQDLASIVGCSREMVSRIMKDLVRGGYLTIANDAIHIHRPLPTSW